MLVLYNTSVATLAAAGGIGLIPEGAIVIDGSAIAWVGAYCDLPEIYAGVEHQSLDGRLVTPALVDCHTHLVFAGSRAREFEMRLEGSSYEEIAERGGGIIAKVSATRAASEESLLQLALMRIDALIAEGVGAVEIKSGYGLDSETELRILRVARKISAVRPVRVRTSFLGAHAVPTSMNADEYLDKVCLPTLQGAYREGLVDAVDGFCETIAFTTNQMERVFCSAAALGLPIKLHAEQLSNSGGTVLAAKHNALSADHLEYATDEDVKTLAQSDSVAILLPGAYYTLKQIQRPPVEAFRKHKVPMAVATDWNPGSSPLGSLLLAMNMASTLFGLTPEETLAGTTRNAAKALGYFDCGQIRPGARADLAVWDLEHPAELSYRIGQNALYARMFEGKYDNHDEP